MQQLTVAVVIGVTPDRWVRVWRERRPDVPLTVVPAADAPTALAAGADLVFTRLPHGVEADVHAIPLWEETPVVVAAKDHPIRVFDAVALADLGDEERREGWDEGTLDLVAAGHGVALLPQSVFRAINRKDLVARPVDDAEPTRIALVWPRAAGGPLVDEFIGVVRGRTANSSRGPGTSDEPDRSSAPPRATRPRPPAPRRGRRARG